MRRDHRIARDQFMRRYDAKRARQEAREIEREELAAWVAEKAREQAAANLSGEQFWYSPIYDAMLGAADFDAAWDAVMCMEEFDESKKPYQEDHSWKLSDSLWRAHEEREDRGAVLASLGIHGDPRSLGC